MLKSFPRAMQRMRAFWMTAVLSYAASSAFAQLSDVTQPGDLIVPTSNNSPGSEGVANAIDNQPTKYLNFDRLNTGFTVTPQVGLTVVQCLTLTSANDAPERDPASYLLEGSYDGANFTVITNGALSPFTARFQKQVVTFKNDIPYAAYRLTFPEVTGPGGNSMQISEVEFLGFAAPTDVTQPGDPVVASSNNSPGSEGVANVIDNQPTKYLNFDRLNTGFTVKPNAGPTKVTGLSLTSANDAPERDPATFLLEGSLDGTSFVEVASGVVPAFPTRFYKNYVFFSNTRSYTSYRLTFPSVTGPGGNSMQISEVEFLGVTADPVQDVTQPGDIITPTSNNSPGSEGVANAIDNQPTKYLNFDRLNTGFTVSPSAGLTVVSGLTLTSANDAPERDPSTFKLEGSYNGTDFTDIASGSVPAFASRFAKQTVFFNNNIPYLHYRLTFPEVVGPGGNSMQIAEVEFLGVLAPTDVTVPGDVVVATSNNSPGSEGVANVIDNQPTKYLNFDRLNTGFTVTPAVGDTIVTGLTLTSANDAPERDPSSFTLEGSNDGVNYVAVSSGNVPAFTARFQKQYVFFTENTKSFKSYRLIFPTVTGPGGNSMQISEVEFLGVTPGSVNNTPVDDLIRRQPSDTPALAGTKASFRIQLTGPWKVQWYRNGAKIPGATAAVYTTGEVVPDDDGAKFYAVVQSSKGVQTSDEVMLSVFSPSTTVSYGYSFVGGGANGTPTAMLPEDITGFHQQAYWNNLPGGSGNLTESTNSNNEVDASITFQWASSGTWGAGTGIDDAASRLLNGLIISATTPANPAFATLTFSGLPPGKHSILLYTVQVPLEFFNMDFSVTTKDGSGNDVVQQRFLRPQNADEYNPSPGYILVTSDTADTRAVGNMIRFDNLESSDGTVVIRFNAPGREQPPGAEPIRGPGLNALQLLINPETPPDAPVIVKNPVSVNGVVGGQVALNVKANGAGLGYQWLKNGQVIRGATGSQLVLSDLKASDAARYAVAISNPAGRILSSTVVVGVLDKADISSGLIAHFKFDETQGDIADNSVASGQDGEVRGTDAPTWAAGKIGNALSFNGTDNFVLVPSYTKPSKSMTVAAWVNSSTDAYGPIVNNWVLGRPIGSRGQFFTEIGTVNLPDVGDVPVLRGQLAVGPNQPSVVAPIDATPFSWHHFAVSANGANLNVFWDGVLVGTLDYLGDINSSEASAPFPWLAIGGELTLDAETQDIIINTAQAPSLWSGAIDDLGLWGRSLSGIEVKALYDGGLAGKNLGQVAFPVQVIEPEAVTLTVNRTSAGIVISWPTPPVGSVLQSTTSLTAPNWQAVPGVANNSVTIANPAGTVFFRLFAP